jgi:hypothetical protein
VRSSLIQASPGVRTDWRWVLLTKFLTMMEIKLIRTSIQDLQTNYLGRFDTMQPVDLMDLEEIGVRVKHINLVSHAQGYLFLRKGIAVRVNDSRAAIRFFQQAIVKFEEVLHTNTYHKLSLRNCALCLLYLNDELKHISTAYVATRPRASERVSE